jgi:hypothetical protein
MTFRELQDLTLRELGFNPGSVAEEPRTRIKDRLNSWQRRMATEPGLSRYLRDSYAMTMTTVAGRSRYGVPLSVERIIAIRDLANETLLECVALDDLRRVDPGMESSGNPTHWALLGQYPVHTQPSDASTLALKSTSASDTAIVANVEYLNSSGIQLTDSVTLTGTTAVAVGTNVVEILTVRLSAAPVGSVTIYEDTDAGTVLGYIYFNRLGSRSWHVQLYPIPTSALTLTLDAVRRLTDMIYDYDEPILPRDFHDVLSLAVQSDEWRRKGDLEQAQVVRAEYEARKRDLIAWTWNLPAYLPGGASEAGGSRLGPWFPRGT